MEASLKTEKDKNEEVLVSHNADLIDTTASLKRHQEELNNSSRWQREAMRRFEALEARVSSLDLEYRSKEICIESLEENIAELRSSLEEMESRLCWCADKENEEGSNVEVKVEEEEELEYASDNKYRTPLMGVLRELRLIEDVLDQVAGPSSSRGCCLEQPIILSDEEETVVENKVPIPI